MSVIPRFTLCTVTAAALAASVVTAIPAGAAGSSLHRAARSGVRITAIYFNSPGRDNGSNKSLDAEWVAIRNTSKHTARLTGWKLKDATGNTYTFVVTRLRPGRSVRVHTGHGSNNPRNRFWGNNSYVWNNTGDRALLRDARGRTVDTCRYGAPANPKARC
jgi:hypothetical protein